MAYDYDYIIVGSGAGGSVLADRLTRDPAVRVLVLEAGRGDRNPIHRVPKGFYFTMFSPRYTKKYVTEPAAPGAAGDTWLRGRVVGGSTTLNGLIWNRGWADDYDALEAAGNPGWGWATFLNAFKEIERFQLGASDLRGGAGPVDVEIGGPPEPVSETFLASAARNGLERVLDVNGSDGERTGYTQFCTRRGLRLSAANSFLHPAARRPNLTVRTGTEVGQILFDGTRATGVRAEHAGTVREYRARREVLLCGGSLETPLLLERSGIGRGDALRAAGIDLRVESPNVGERMSEHRGLRFMYRVSGAEGYNHLVRTQARQLVTGAKYLARRDGIMAQGSANVLTYFTAEPGAARPDVIGFFNPISTKAMTLHDTKMRVEDTPGLMLSVYPLRPTSRGSIHSTGPGLGDPARVVPNYLDSEYDRKVLAGAGARARELFATGPIADLLAGELAPGLEITDPEDYVGLAKAKGASGYHTLGTCAMGPDDADVVDARLRVRGVSGLRVVDASVFPGQPSGNTSAPTQALAWHAAGLIAEENE